MSGSWEAMLEDEQRLTELQRRRDVSRLTKAELIERLVEAERALEELHRCGPALTVADWQDLQAEKIASRLSRVTTEHEIGRQDDGH